MLQDRELSLAAIYSKFELRSRVRGKGKGGGARVITYLMTENREIYLLTIYDKSEFDSVDDRILRRIVGDLL
jgi:hypothetical protein